MDFTFVAHPLQQLFFPLSQSNTRKVLKSVNLGLKTGIVVWNMGHYVLDLLQSM